MANTDSKFNQTEIKDWASGLRKPKGTNAIYQRAKCPRMHVIAALQKRCVENDKPMENNASCFRGHIKPNNKEQKKNGTS